MQIEMQRKPKKNQQKKKIWIKKQDQDEIQNGSQISRKSYDDNNLIITIYVHEDKNWKVGHKTL